MPSPTRLSLLVLLLVAAAAATQADARSLLAKPSTTPAPAPAPAPTPAPNEDKNTGQCTTADEADPASCFGDAAVKFSCGNTQEKNVWKLPACPGTTVPCRLSGSGSTVCAGDTITVTDNGAAGITIDAPGTFAGPVMVKGGNGACTFSDAYSKTLRAPTNCGADKHQCGLGHIDTCYCKGANPSFVSAAAPGGDAGVASMPAEALPCKPVTLPTVTAVDACGLPVPVTVTAANPDVPTLAGADPPVFASGSTLACGANTVTFTAAHPHKPNLRAVIAHEVHVADRVVPASAAALGQGAAVCKKTFQTECGVDVPLVPTLSLSACTITATYAPQKDACGNVHEIPAETLVLDKQCSA